MLKPVFISICTIVFSFACHAQFKNPPKVNVGLAYRPGAIELSVLSGPGFPPKGYIFKGFNYKNNPYLVVELNQKFNHERWAFQFSNYLTHRYLVTTVDSLNRPIKDLSSLSYDVFLDLQYEFRFFKNTNSFFYIGAGVGYMNNARKFTRQTATGNFDSSGKETYRQARANLSFLAPRISFGYTRKKLSAWLIAHGTPDNDLQSNPTIWAEIKLLYSLQLRKKKSN